MEFKYQENIRILLWIPLVLCRRTYAIIPSAGNVDVNLFVVKSPPKKETSEMQPQAEDLTQAFLAS